MYPNTFQIILRAGCPLEDGVGLGTVSGYVVVSTMGLFLMDVENGRK